MAEPLNLAILPTLRHPKMVLATQCVVAVVISVLQSKNAGDFFLVVSGLAIAILVSYHSGTYLLPTLLVVLTMVIKHKLSAEHYQILDPSLLTAIEPHCADVKAEEIMALFENDQEKLKDAMAKVGAPETLKLTDETAPLFATYLLSYVKTVNGKCKLPMPSKARANERGAVEPEVEMKPF